MKQKEVKADSDILADKCAQDYFKGQHDGIKKVIEEIDKVEGKLVRQGYMLSKDVELLRNGLGRLVYENWPNRN